MYKSNTAAVFLMLAGIFLAGCSASSLQPHVKDTAPDRYGYWEVGHSAFTAVDADRDGRTLSVDAWYPVDIEDIGPGRLSAYRLAGPLTMHADIAMRGRPVSRHRKRKLLIFSHGYGAPNFQSTALMEHLASHGFIVIAPAHSGNTLGDDGDDFTTAGGNRVPDVSFLIDHMFARNADPEDAFYARIDTSGVGVVGHSYGGMTALGAAAGWGRTVPDSRVKAVVPISAVVVGDMQRDKRPPPYAGFTQAQLSSVSVPVLLLGGTEDKGVLIENNRVAFDWLQDDAIRVDIIGANHNHFANVCALGDFLKGIGILKPLWSVIGAGQLHEPYDTSCSGEPIAIGEVQRLQNLYVTAFFKRYLGGMTDYDRYLDPEYARAQEAKVSVYRK